MGGLETEGKIPKHQAELFKPIENFFVILLWKWNQDGDPFPHLLQAGNWSCMVEAEYSVPSQGRDYLHEGCK